MSRSKDYQTLLNSKEWKILRAAKLKANPLCEMCMEEGKVSSAIDVHHIVPVESATNIRDMARLCFDPNNLVALCIRCHSKVHADERSHSVENHKKRQKQSLQRWIERHETRSDD